MSLWITELRRCLKSSLWLCPGLLSRQGSPIQWGPFNWTRCIVTNPLYALSLICMSRKWYPVKKFIFPGGTILGCEICFNDKKIGTLCHFHFQNSCWLRWYKWRGTIFQSLNLCVWWLRKIMNQKVGWLLRDNAFDRTSPATPVHLTKHHNNQSFPA